MSKRCVPEQRPDGSKSSITGAGAIFPLFLKVVEEGADEWRIQIADVQLRRLRAAPLGRKAQHQSQGVPIGSNCMRAGLPLTYQAIGEERLQGGGESAHEAAPSPVWRRSAARISSSGTAERYQLFRHRNNWYLTAVPELMELAAAHLARGAPR